MKKKLLLTLLVVMTLVCLFAITVSADTLVPSDSNEYGTLSVVDGVPEPTIIDKNAKTVVEANGKYYTIPTYYLLADNSYFTWSVHANVKTALGLGSDVRGNLVRVEIPEGIKTSYNGGNGGLKMESSTKLIEASIPTTMEIMGDHFFGKCTALTTIKGLENSKIDGVYTQAFYQNKFSSITLPSTVTTIGTNAFRDNANLTSIVIPDNVTSIGDHAFASCTSLATITISENSKLTKFEGEYQFEKTAISSFYFPSSLVSIGKGGAFYQCGSLETLINFENLKITDIPYRTFAGGPKFATITFPNGIESIGDNAFNGHKITGDIILPNTVKSLGDHAFAGSNVVMGKLVLGAGLTTITGTYTFEKSDFSAIYIPAGVTAFPQGAFKETVGNGVVYYYTGTLEQLKALIKNTNTSDNGNFLNATIVTLEEFEKIEDTSKKNYIVHDYSACDAFYAGIHTNATTYGFDGEDKLSSNFCEFNGCTRCDEKTTTIIGTLITNKGYSKEQGGTYFAYTIVFNKDVISLYLEKTEGATFSYGVLAAKYTKDVSTGILFDEAGAPINDCVAIDATGAAYSVYSLKITDLDKVENSKAQALYCCAYVVDNGAIKYVADEITDKAVTICYDDIDVIIDTATPPATGDDQNA